MLKQLALLLTMLTALQASHANNDTADVSHPERSLILISIDGVRHDYLSLHPSPNLNRIARAGLQASALQPVFPTKTFPNHYSLVTGLYPEQHGIVDNNMFDPGTGDRFSIGNTAAVQSSEWWQGEPIWVTAERQGVRSATFFFPGSEAEIAGYRPSQWFEYDASIAHRQRVDTVLEWLSLPAAQQPRMITLYFSEVDTQGHHHGPYSSEVATAMADIDAEIGYLFEHLDARDWLQHIDIMIVSDHGMTEVDLRRHIVIDEIFDPQLAEQVNYSRELVSIFPKPDMAPHILAQLAAGLNTGATVLTADTTPPEWSRNNHPRIAPIRVLADLDHVLLRRQWLHELSAESDFARPRGGHGYDNREPDMQGIFIAHGPSFRPATRTGSISIVDLYHVMTRILGITAAENAGDASKAKLLLRTGH